MAFCLPVNDKQVQVIVFFLFLYHMSTEKKISSQTAAGVVVLNAVCLWVQVNT